MTITLERPGNVPGRIFMACGRRSLWRHLLCRREGQRHGRDARSWGVRKAAAQKLELGRQRLTECIIRLQSTEI